MWIHIYPNWKTCFNSKNGRNRSFSLETKALLSFISMRRKWLWCPIMKGKEIILLIHVYPNWTTNFNSKNSRKAGFSYETMVSISFIPTGRMCLWCPIMKKNEIIMWIHVYPNRKMNFDSKKGRKGSFSYETKASISLSQWEECVYGTQWWKERRLLCESIFIPIGRQTLILNMVESDFFLWNQSIKIDYYNKKNVFIVPNQEKKEYYYMNPSLSQLKDEF